MFKITGSPAEQARQHYRRAVNLIQAADDLAEQANFTNASKIQTAAILAQAHLAAATLIDRFPAIVNDT